MGPPTNIFSHRPPLGGPRAGHNSTNSSLMDINFVYPGHVTLCVTIFWTKSVMEGGTWNDQSPAMIQKANDLLRRHGLSLTSLSGDNWPALLDQPPPQYILHYDREVEDIDDIKKVRGMIQETSWFRLTPERAFGVIVIVCPFGSPSDGNNRSEKYHGQEWNGTLLSAATNWSDFVLINSRNWSSDRVTLLHEIGHAAGLSDTGDTSANFMSWGNNRTEMNKLQVLKLAGSSFAR